MRRASFIASLAMIIVGCAGTTSIQDQRVNSLRTSRQILLTVHQDAGVSALRFTGSSSKRYLRRGGYQADPAVERTLNQLASEHGLRRLQGWPIRSLGVYCEVFEVPESTAIDTVIDRLSVDPRVDLVQRMHIFETLVSRYDDPYAEMQFAIRDLGVEQAHDLATGRGVTVALIDSGVDVNHPDLENRVSVTHDLVKSPKAPSHGEVHGTAVAGIIASVVNNSEGIIGIAPDVDIAALRACWPVVSGSSESHCSSFTLAQALDVAITLEPHIINLSLAGPFDPLLSRLLDKAMQQGAVVVAAYPEGDDQNAGFPASHPRVIVAHSPSSATESISAYTLGAPATEILTTTPNAGYAFLSGNSLAAAHVSGVVALLMEANPEIDVDHVVRLLSATSTDSGSLPMIHACHALAMLSGTEFCDAQNSYVLKPR